MSMPLETYSEIPSAGEEIFAFLLRQEPIKHTGQVPYIIDY